MLLMLSRCVRVECYISERCSRCEYELISASREKAVKTYTRAIEDLDANKLPDWKHLPVRTIGALTCTEDVLVAVGPA